MYLYIILDLSEELQVFGVFSNILHSLPYYPKGF